MPLFLALAAAVVGFVELVLVAVHQLGAVLCEELGLRLDQLRVVHRPLLDRLLFLVAVLVPVVGAPVGVEVVAVGVHVVPSRKFGCINVLSLEESSVGAVGLVGKPSWVLVERRDRYHLVELSMVRVRVLNHKVLTA